MTVYSPNLNIPHLDANSASPEVPVDNAIDALDAAITGRVVVNLGATNTVTLTQDQQAAGKIFVLSTTSPGPSAAVTVNFAAKGMGLFTVENQTGFTATIKVTGQLGVLPTLAYKSIAIFQNDGIRIQKLT